MLISSSTCITFLSRTHYSSAFEFFSKNWVNLNQNLDIKTRISAQKRPKWSFFLYIRVYFQRIIASSMITRMQTTKKDEKLKVLSFKLFWWSWSILMSRDNIHFYKKCGIFSQKWNKYSEYEFNVVQGCSSMNENWKFIVRRYRSSRW